MEEEGREGAIAYVCTTGLCHFVVVLWRDSEKGCALRVGNGGGGTISRACGTQQGHEEHIPSDLPSPAESRGP